MKKAKPNIYKVSFEIIDDAKNPGVSIRRRFEVKEGRSWKPVSLDECTSLKTLLVCNKLEDALPLPNKVNMSQAIITTAAVLLVDPVMNALDSVGEIPEGIPTFGIMADVLEFNKDLFMAVAKKESDRAEELNIEGRAPVIAVLKHFAETGDGRLWLSMLVTCAKTEYGKELLERSEWKFFPVNSDEQNDHDEQKKPQFWRSNKVYSVTTPETDDEKKK